LKKRWRSDENTANPAKTRLKLDMYLLDTDHLTILERGGTAAQRLGTMDLKIAAIAISRSATLLTRNLSDFGKISNLQVENWLV
jgi:tRNA(fMet)-specific endonuclease VapC